MGVVTMTWHIPAQHPANISLTTVNLPLKTHTGLKTKDDIAVKESCLAECHYSPIFAQLVAEEVISS